MKVRIEANGNPLPHESKVARIIKLKGDLDRDGVFSQLFPDLAAKKHSSDSLIVPKWRIL